MTQNILNEFIKKIADENNLDEKFAKLYEILILHGEYEASKYYENMLKNITFKYLGDVE